MGMWTVNGLRTHVQRLSPREREGAPVVVCVHGLGYDSLASFFLTLAAPLSQAGVDVVTYDLRGHGRSERPPTGYRLDDFVADLRELVEQVGHDRPVHLLGNSFGGSVAFALAAHHPELVASIVSIESEPPTPIWSEKMSRTFRNVHEAMADRANQDWVAQTFGEHYARLTRTAVQIIGDTTIVDEVATGSLLDDDGLAAITCPVLSVLGSEGFQSDDLLVVESLLPWCRTEIVPRQNHSVLVERHPVVRRLVLEWLVERGALAAPERDVA